MKKPKKDKPDKTAVKITTKSYALDDRIEKKLKKKYDSEKHASFSPQMIHRDIDAALFQSVDETMLHSD